MTTETITLEISQDLLAAIAYFQDRKLSLGKAAQLAGLNRLEFMDVLSDRGITIFDYDESVLTSELDSLSAFPDRL